MPTNNEWMNWHSNADTLPSLDNYSYEDIRRWLGDLEIRKAQSYQKSISRLERLDETDLSAFVQGTARAAYHVDIHLSQGHLISLCTCPVASNCKHVTAVLLAFLAQRGHEAPTHTPRPHVMQWLSDLRSHLNPPPRKPPSTTYLLHWILEPRSRRHQGPVLSCQKARLNKQGICTERTPWHNFEAALRRPPSFLDDVDQRALRRLLLEDPYANQSGLFELGPRH
ncbi:MAG: SWIM zinc finger domain-containing protein, partial [Acidithiobacillus sp.]